jgi:hypothetical protein
MFINPIKLLSFIVFSLTLCACNNDSSSKKQSASPVEKKQITLAPTSTEVKTYDGPFGLTMGISSEILIKNFKFNVDEKTPLWFYGQPPNPSNLFTNYHVFAGEKTGICSIIASTERIEFNDSGDEIKRRADEIAKAISIKYGKGEQFDYGNESGRTNLWAYSADNGNAKYSYAWEAKSKVKLSKELEGIIVDVVPLDYKIGLVTARYYFENSEQCDKELALTNSSNL